MTGLEDHIFVFFGLLEPEILRPQGDGAQTFVGAAYIHGITNGEWQKHHDLGYIQKNV